MRVFRQTLRRGPLTLAILAACLVAASAGSTATAPPQTVLKLVEAVDRAEPVDQVALARLLGRDLECTQGGRVNCHVRNVDIGGGMIGRLKLNLFQGRSWLVLELLHADRQCVTIDSLVDRFGRGAVVNGCTDGHSCSYMDIQRPWGKLSVGLPDDPAETCANSIVMLSDPR